MYYDQNNRNKNNLCGGGSVCAGFHIRRGQTHHGPGLLPEVYRRTGGKAGDGFGTNGGLHSSIGGDHALPGDTATPIADKLADLSGYFLIVLCAIFLEKYLLTITAAAAFKVLIPAACAAFAAAALFPRLRRTAGALAWKLALFGVAIMLVIPVGIRVSDLIEDTYQASIAATIQEAKEATDTIQSSQNEGSATEQSGISGFFSKVTDSITGAAAGAWRSCGMC